MTLRIVPLYYSDEIPVLVTLFIYITLYKYILYIILFASKSYIYVCNSVIYVNKIMDVILLWYHSF